VSVTPTGSGDDNGFDTGTRPPRPPAASFLRFLAAIAVLVAVLAGFLGVWRAQTQSVSANKLAERQAHERAYGQLAGDPAGPGAARVRNITVTDARIGAVAGSAAGVLTFRVQNSGPPVRLTSVTATVGGVAVPRVLYVSGPDVEPQQLPEGGVPVGTGQELALVPGGRSFALIGLPTDTAGERAHVTVTFTDIGAVPFEAPIQR
jgi:copper(I)-binding protein